MRGTAWIRCLVLATALASIGAAPAGAATVSSTTKTECDPGAPPKVQPSCGQITTLTFAAGAGETNLVTVTNPTGAVDVTDAGTPPAAGSGCTSASAAEVTCPAPQGASITASLGDGNDSWSSAVDAAVDGGPGDDVISGGSAQFAMLSGGPGDDTLTVPANSIAKLEGGPGADRMTGGYAYYGERTAPVFVDLTRPAPQGEAGEGDTITGARGVIGGAGDDDLIGSSRADDLDGGAGADRIDGGAGNDTLAGGADPTTRKAARGKVATGIAPDRITGGAGNDKIRATDRPLVADGGAGNDSIEGEAVGDVLTGGDGNDDISDEANGATTIHGGAGNDDLEGTTAVYGDSGSDTILGTGREDGGPGNDHIDVIGDASCGTGRDFADTDGIDSLVPRDCEYAGGRDVHTDARPRIAKGRATLRIFEGCDAFLVDPAVRCTFRVTLEDRSGRRLGAVTVRRGRRRNGFTAQIALTRTPARGARIRVLFRAVGTTRIGETESDDGSWTAL
jgi:Ca2+-binding RTX toxin-like protein